MKFMHNTPPWVDSIRANFDYIAKKLLPSASGDDNGKVLTVVDGEWAAAPASGGGGGLTLYGPYKIFYDGGNTLTIASGSSETITFDTISSPDFGDKYDIDDNTTLFILAGFNISDSEQGLPALTSLSLPEYDSGTQKWSIGSAVLYNPSASSISIDDYGVDVTVYSTKDLPLHLD